MTVVHQDGPNKYSVVETVTTQKGSRTMSLDAVTHKVYMVGVEYGPTPPAQPGQTRPPRPPIIPESFSILVIEK